MIYSEGLEVQPAPEGLEWFVNAQKDVIEEALAELRAGWKRTHWMWFVLPQMRGLGMSNMSQRFGIASLDEARAYLAHDALGPRLLESMEILDRLEGRSVREIFGDVDAQKFQSCLTLFAHACATDQADRHFHARDDCLSIFERLLAKYFAGHADQRTEQLLHADR